ncbi:UDP-N-acetylmuramate dehydrogenase [Polynucleobacter sphagniphilus]|uniref:UDP-N-acetylmuramate dehydrogenase n=1 Tax=Polynucleobacter sphagniphilus TaxID=1743169 RepID=UPI002474AACE|nr:UDP-N-acetylmuramate dehydrogenase [Polynucleobacter sphagniphilus]MDH6248422.1 UDP-N-acetylmuramate dehydrogenase [Polynucleobacter sphagniphilus]
MNCAQNAPLPAKLLSHYDLTDRNTFGLQCQAQFAYEVSAPEQLPALLSTIKDANLAWRVLGGGSNVILPANLPGATLLINIPGCEISKSDVSYTEVIVGAGMGWHEFVSWTLDNDLPGLENLALIPGTVGAAPIQNIGAYGLEVAQFIDFIEAYDVQANAFVTLSKDECRFAYRDSYFKQNPGRFIVTKVAFKIPKPWSPKLDYAELAQVLADIQDPRPQDIFHTVCQIRTRKLPDPKVIGNAGSFFQNPLVPHTQYEMLSKEFPGLPSYPDQSGNRKLAAGWLIDQCGFKGQRVGAVGVYQNQALVLVNHGGATAQDILDLAKHIQETVLQKFGVPLQIEPNII